MTQQATLAYESRDRTTAHRQVSERWSARVLVVAVIAALPLLLWFGRDHWFYLDEWEVLEQTNLTSPGYFDGHNGHWITLVRLDYRLNFALWGLRTYVPYQLPAVLAHLGAALLLREVIRRCGARGWIATAAALAFVFFGSGRENMTLGFQVSLTGSLLCSLALLLLSDGPKAVTRRDWLCLGLALVGLMTSSVFVAMLVGFGVATVLRRGLRVATFYALPLGVIYTGWYLRYGSANAAPLRLTGGALRYARRMFWDGFEALAQGGVGALLLALAAFGLVTTVYQSWRSGSWAQAALPLGLAVSWLAFASFTAAARAETAVAPGTPSRFLYICAGLFLPLIALGAEGLARRRMLLGAAALIPLAVGLPGNLDELSETSGLFRTNRQLVFAIAHSPFVDDVPADVMPMRLSGFQPPVTAGWLARQGAAGRIPEPDPPAAPALALTATSRLVLSQELGLGNEPGCPQLTVPLTLTLHAGDQLRFAGAILVSVTDGRHESRPRPFLGGDGALIRTLAGPVDVVVRGSEGMAAQVCTPPD
jgi:hypothetical protein